MNKFIENVNHEGKLRKNKVFYKQKSLVLTSTSGWKDAPIEKAEKIRVKRLYANMVDILNKLVRKDTDLNSADIKDRLIGVLG